MLVVSTCQNANCFNLVIAIAHLLYSDRELRWPAEADRFVKVSNFHPTTKRQGILIPSSEKY